MANKFHAKRCEIDAYKFASLKEGARYRELKALCNASNPKDRIQDLKVHPRYPLTVDGELVGHVTPDFEYRDSAGRWCVDDTKGGKATKTEASMLRLRLFAALYRHATVLINGEPLKLVSRISPQRAFEIYAVPEPSTGCWLWTGPTKGMYGSCNDRYAHHVAIELDGRAIPPGQKVLHKCDVPLCVNPTHLFFGTQKDNVRDMYQKGRGVPPPRKIGVANVKAKLSDADVIAIREAAAKGATTAALIARYQITNASVANIVSGRTWKHLPVLQAQDGRTRRWLHRREIAP